MIFWQHHPSLKLPKGFLIILLRGKSVNMKKYTGGGAVKLDSMWQHRLTRPLHVQHTYYCIIYKQNPFHIISRGVQR